jgi:hypothetical protein
MTQHFCLKITSFHLNKKVEIQKRTLLHYERRSLQPLGDEMVADEVHQLSAPSCRGSRPGATAATSYIAPEHTIKMN